MPHLDTSNCRIHFLDCGQGPCISFLHGSGGNHLSWWQQIPTLSRRYRCLAPDLRGYGLSRVEVPPEDEGVYSEDLAFLLDHLNIESTHVVGQSIGGHYALQFALRFPSRVLGLVLADTLAGIADSGVIAAKEAAGKPPVPLIERALSAQCRGRNPDLTFLYQMIEQLNRVDHQTPMLASRKIDVNELASLNLPSLFIVGEDDPVAPREAVAIAANLVAGSKLRVIPRSGHSPYFEQPELFNQAILEFLSEFG